LVGFKVEIYYDATVLQTSYLNSVVIFALTSPTGGGRSVGIVRSRT